VAAGASLPERRSMVYAGTHVVAGRGRAVVTGAGAGTELGHIATLVAGARHRRTPLESAIDRAGRWLGAGALVSAAAVFVVSLALGGELIDAFLIAVALAVAAVPEGLPAAITIVLALGVRRMARRRAIVRRRSRRWAARR
jgi:Ca2+-transporting ATPase